MKLLSGCAAGFVALISLSCLAGFRLNLTPSLPLGIYRLTTDPLRIGQYAYFCLESREFIRLAADRGYAGVGTCPGMLRPLGKEIYGLPGDRIDFVQGQIRINGQILPGSIAKNKDHQNRIMPAPMLQSGIIPADYVLMLSLHHPGSFDSRYFGLVPMAALKPVQPVITL